MLLSRGKAAAILLKCTYKSLQCVLGTVSGFIHRLNKMAEKSESSDQSERTVQAKSTPKDALVMGAILKEMGINEYDPRVINQMLEFTYRK